MNSDDKILNDLYESGKNLKKLLGWDKLSNDEIEYKIIEAIKGKEVAEKWLEYNKLNKENSV